MQITITRRWIWIARFTMIPTRTFIFETPVGAITQKDSPFKIHFCLSRFCRRLGDLGWNHKSNFIFDIHDNIIWPFRREAKLSWIANLSLPLSVPYLAVYSRNSMSTPCRLQELLNTCSLVFGQDSSSSSSFMLWYTCSVSSISSNCYRTKSTGQDEFKNQILRRCWWSRKCH